MIDCLKINDSNLKNASDELLDFIIILLWIAAASALILLPAIFVLLEELGVGSSGGSSSMARKLGLGRVASRGDIDAVDATLIPDHGDAW